MAGSLSERYLAVRAVDHIVFGVQWWDAEPIAGGGPARLRIGPDGGGLLITFPPQHLGEGAFEVGEPLFLSSGVLSGLSQIAVELDADTVVELDLSGILSALETGRVLGRRFEDGTDATVIELPYGLRSAPAAASGGVTICVHPSEPVVGPSSKAIGLWRTRLDGSGNGRLVAAQEFLLHDPEPSRLPLDAGKRPLIVAATSSHPAIVSRLDLSALGGSMSVASMSDSVEWSHEVALGRDQRIRFVAHGILYPFGHRAIYIEATERKLDADDTAALRVHRSLIVTEPSKSVVIDDGSLNRRFPFDDVEVTTLVFSNLGKPLRRDFTRPAPDIAEEVLARDEKQASRNALKAGIDPILTQDRTVEELGTQEAAEFLGLQGAVAALGTQLGEAQANDDAIRDLHGDLDIAIRALDQLLSSVPQNPDGSTSGFEQEIAEAEANIRSIQDAISQIPVPAPGAIAALQNQLTSANARLAELQPIVDAQCQADLSVADLAAGDPSLQAVLDAQQILVLDQEIAALDAVIGNNPAEEHHEWILGPTIMSAPPLPSDASPESLSPLLFPVRCSTRTAGQPDVCLDVPLVFVLDYHLDATEHFPAFDSLIDGEGGTPLQTILEAFATSRTAGGVTTLAGTDDLPGINVGLAGTDIDVVHGAVQAAGDRLEVHGMTLVGLAHDGGFVPAISEYKAVLPAVRGLFGASQDEVRRVGYRPTFLTQGDAEDLALEFLGETPMGIDFRAQADRSGALLAPVIEATGISRLNGPVSVEGVLSAATGPLDPSKVLGEGATLLGFDLRSLIGELPEPPKIVQEVIGGRPSIRVKWGGIVPPEKPIVLKSEEIFDAEPDGAKATLTLTADVTPDGISTECIVRDFALCFPSREDPLLRLSFTSVVFKQTIGGEPDLSVHGVEVEFLGDLQLLEKLQDSIALGSNVPKVTVSSGGIGVGYAFAVPNADCGQFLLRNIAVRAGLDVPFQPTDDRPIVMSLGFASRAKPFNLSVMALGGGGYIEVELSKDGLRRMELSMEFGATLALNFVIVSAEVHALAGARAEIGPGTHVAITGYVRIGGSVELLGLVSVTIEILVSLRYDKDTKSLFGRATVVVEIDLTLYSDSIELDSGEWRLLGGGGPSFDVFSLTRAGGDRDAGLEAWRRYRRAFAKDVVA